MTIHDLKCWPEFFVGLRDGTKNFTIRKDDRTPRFKVGDTLHIMEWDPEKVAYTGKYVVREVTCVWDLAKLLGVPPGKYVGMGLKP